MTFSILTLTIFIQKILKVLKDTLVITDPNIGIQLIPFLKIWALIPISMLAIKGIYICKSKYSYKATYGIALGFFMFTLSGYVFFIKPIETSLFISINFENHSMPQYMKGFYLMVRYWPLSLFYIICDLWSIIMFSILFWMYVDEIVSLDQGKRFYPLFSIDVGGIVLAPIVALSSFMSKGLWEKQLELLMILIFVLGFVLWGLFSKTYQKYKIPTNYTRYELSKSSRSFLRSFIQWSRYPFVIHLALIVFIFEFGDTLFELLWKGILFKLTSDPKIFSTYLANILSISGVLSTIIALFFSTTLLHKLSWYHLAVIAPVLFGLLTLCFFLSYCFPYMTVWITAPLGISALSLTVLIGAIQICLMSVVKVTVFDNSKNLAFQLCNSEEKGIARSFSTAFANRFGKSTSNVTYQISSIVCADITIAAPYLISGLLMCIPIWLLSLSFTSKQFLLRSTKEVN